jgi:hypothetical protein
LLSSFALNSSWLPFPLLGENRQIECIRHSSITGIIWVNVISRIERRPGAQAICLVRYVFLQKI